MKPEPTDPPMEPMDGTERWMETGPEPILDDADLAVLFVRVGMATNALTSQIQAGYDAAKHRHGAVKMRDILTSLVTSVAYTNEGIRLAQENMNVLRSMAKGDGIAEELLKRVGKLCGGKHPADYILKRGRNNLGFHWDDDVIRRSVLEYGRNAKLVWIEMSGNESTQRLASDVIGHALLFEITNQPGGAEVKHDGISEALGQIQDAMEVIVQFFAAAFFGYMRKCGGVLRNRRV
jgi:hypothetical protein